MNNPLLVKELCVMPCNISLKCLTFHANKRILELIDNSVFLSNFWCKVWHASSQEGLEEDIFTKVADSDC